MSFSEVLKGITEDVRGAEAAAIVGMDGIIVEEYAKGPGYDLQSIGAEYGGILKAMNEASQSLQLGKTDELLVSAGTKGIIIRKIDEDYFIAVVLSSRGWMGKARHKARVAAMGLEKEF